MRLDVEPLNSYSYYGQYFTKYFLTATIDIYISTSYRFFGLIFFQLKRIRVVLPIFQLKFAYCSTEFDRIDKQINRVRLYELLKGGARNIHILKRFIDQILQIIDNKAEDS